MKLSLGFSPCPNDTFIFDAMVHGRIDTEGLEFEYVLADVEELNRRSFMAELDIVKVSYHAYAFLAEDYLILDCGSALGHKNGPLLISRTPIKPNELESAVIGIPGKFTTANLLLSIAFPEAVNRKEIIFSSIEDAVIRGEVDAGVIIHESRFTYESKGLSKIADLGEIWTKQTNHPIPLGAIIINRRIPEHIAHTVNRVLGRSIDFAQHDSSSSFTFVKDNAQEMDPDVMNKHIKLYVNEFTRSMGAGGKSAVRALFQIAANKNAIPELPDRIFLDEE